MKQIRVITPQGERLWCKWVNYGEYELIKDRTQASVFNHPQRVMSRLAFMYAGTRISAHDPLVSFRLDTRQQLPFVRVYKHVP